MSIVRDAQGSGLSSNGGKTITYNHTCTGSNLILWVGVVSGDNTMTGITYNGVSLTQVGSSFQLGTEFLTLWYLIAPATGSNSLVITRSGTTNFMRGLSASYTGVQQSGQPDAHQDGTSGTNSVTDSVTVVANNSWCIALGYANTSASTNATSVISVNAVQLYDNQSFGDIPSGSFSMTITVGAGTVAIRMASFAPAISSSSLTATAGSMTLTGYAALFGRGVNLIAQADHLILTGYNALFKVKGWINQNKNSSSWSDQSKHTSNWTNQSKH